MNTVFSYRTWLNKKFKNSKKKNISFSLRSYAKMLGLSAPFLSSILKGDSSISEKKLLEICKRLHLSDELTNLMLYSLQWEKSGDLEVKQKLESQMRVYLERKKTKILSPPTHSSQWHLYAFWVLLSCKQAQYWNFEHYLDILAINKEELNSIIQSLIHQGMIKKTEQGTYIKSEERILLESKLPDQSIKNIHQSLIKLAAQSITDQSPASRYSATEFIAINDESLLRIRKLTENYLDEVQAIARTTQNPDQIYSMSLHLFNPTFNSNFKFSGES